MNHRWMDDREWVLSKLQDIIDIIRIDFTSQTGKGEGNKEQSLLGWGPARSSSVSQIFLNLLYSWHHTKCGTIMSYAILLMYRLYFKEKVKDLMN